VILDTDTVYAYLKAENRLKDTADKLLKRIHEGAMGKIGLSDIKRGGAPFSRN